MDLGLDNFEDKVYTACDDRAKPFQITNDEHSLPRETAWSHRSAIGRRKLTIV